MRILLFIILFQVGGSFAADLCVEEDLAAKLALKVVEDSDTVFATLQEALSAYKKARKPEKYIKTSSTGIPEFPSYSKCEKSFFRVATIPKSIDGLITQNGWESGWMRRSKELLAQKKTPGNWDFDGLPPESPIEDRIIEYVRVKGVPSKFPKHASIVGVLVDPIRTLSVGYHTGFDSGISGNHMRMDEIEVGACAKAPECKKLSAVDSTKVFSDRGLEPRYSTEGEHAISHHIPSACVVATYRIKFQKVDDKCYSENGNCNF